MKKEVNRSVVSLFNKVQEKHPNLSSFMVFQEVCKLIKLKRHAIEVGFLALVDPDDYEIEEEDYEASDEEFKKEFTSAKDYNEKIQGQLIANLMQWKGEESKIKTISGSFLPPMSDEMKELRERIKEAKISNKLPINPYFNVG